MTETSNYKGIVLAGGAGSRLYPLTKVISKQLLPIYNRPMIYYPLSILINAKIKDILIITTPEDQENFKKLLGDGSQWGVKLNYSVQEKPEGIAQSLIIADKWLKSNPVVLILGDNLFFGPNLFSKIGKAINENVGATIFGYHVDDPERYGVLELDAGNNVLSIVEKPDNPASNWIATGLYIYDSNASDYARNLKKSDRGELEITELNNVYLRNNDLKAMLFDKEFSWLDTGTHETLLEASNFVKDIEEKSDRKVADLLIL